MVANTDYVGLKTGDATKAMERKLVMKLGTDINHP
jgi:hypothetical protein